MECMRVCVSVCSGQCRSLSSDKQVLCHRLILNDVLECVDFLWIIVMFLSTVWTLILTAPIHCRGSIGEQVMEC